MKKRLTYYITLPFMYIISKLPDRLLYGFSDLLAFLLCRLFSYRKEIVLNNLHASFPQMGLAEINTTVREFYTNLTDTLLEAFKMRSISAEEISRRFRIIGLDYLKSSNEQGRTVVCIAGHYANWEWGGLAVSAAYKESPVIIIYQPMSNKYHEQYFNRLRSKFGSVMVPTNHVLRQVIAGKGQPALLFLVADQSPSRNDKNLHFNFLNQQTAFYNGPAKIVQRINAIMVFAEVKRIRRGYYEVEMVPLINEPSVMDQNKITQAHVRHLEGVIQRKPADWLWSHRRWKLQ